MGPKSDLVTRAPSSPDSAAMNGRERQLRTCCACVAAACLLSTSSASDAQTAVSPRMSFADMDKMSAVKGWNIAFPSFGDTFLQDYGGWRSGLGSFGIGLIQYNSTRFQANLLDTPREGPRVNPFYESAQNYWGQGASFANFSVIVLTYDLS